jgi:hypothetical protein
MNVNLSSIVHSLCNYKGILKGSLRYFEIIVNILRYFFQELGLMTCIYRGNFLHVTFIQYQFKV